MAACNYAPTEREKRSLECPICLERLRNPKTLPCLHSYCKECLINYTNKGAKTILCPQCKEQIKVPNGSAANFKSNYHLKELVEEVALRKEISEPSLELMCNCCEREDTSSEAVARCLDCNMYLCSNGTAAHRFSALREHVVATIDEIRSGKVRPKPKQKRDAMCMKHPRNRAEIFCLTCEEPICHVCATLKHKSPDHECVEATEATEDRRQLVRQGLKKLEQVKDQFRNDTVQVDEAKREITSQDSNLKSEINESFNKLLLQAETEKNALLKRVDDATSEGIMELKQRAESTATAMTNITSIQSQAEITVDEASDGNFLFMYDTIKTKIDQLCLMEPEKYKEMDKHIFDEGNFKSGALLGDLRRQPVVEYTPVNRRRRKKTVLESSPTHPESKSESIMFKSQVQVLNPKSESMKIGNRVRSRNQSWTRVHQH